MKVANIGSLNSVNIVSLGGVEDLRLSKLTVKDVETPQANLIEIEAINTEITGCIFENIETKSSLVGIDVVNKPKQIVLSDSSFKNVFVEDDSSVILKTVNTTTD